MYANNVVECGDKTLLWTRDEDRAILKACRKKGPRTKVIKNLVKAFEEKTESQIKDRYEELIRLMKKADCAAKQAAYREKRPAGWRFGLFIELYRVPKHISWSNSKFQTQLPTADTTIERDVFERYPKPRFRSVV
eukprot:sb/3474768/